MSRRAQLAFALAGVIPLGLVARYAPLHLPWVISKYAGSALWAVALYLFLGVLLPRIKAAALAAIASILAILVELSRLVPIASVDAFRLTLAGKLLLGRYFSVKDIVAYLIAITAAAWLDQKFLFAEKHRSSTGE